MKSSIALIGFMGTGKSSVGRLLADRLGKKFLELDVLIEERAGMPVPEIFRLEGEPGFRRRETAAIEEIEGIQDNVIACGGGVVLNTINIERLRSFCRIVCLTAAPEVVLERCRKDGYTRPLLKNALLDRIVELLDRRRPYYEKAADITVDTSRLDLPGVIDRIVKKLNEL